MKRVLLSVIVLAMLAVGGAWSYRQFVLLPAVRAPILHGVVDPDSALYRNDRFVGPWTAMGSSYCADVNLKNRMGGYAGYQPALVLDGEVFEPGLLDANPDWCGSAVRRAPWWWLRW